MQPIVVRAVLCLSLLLPWAARGQVSVSIQVAPPLLLVYAQPPVPGEGYIWMPGYWSWSDTDSSYYWVPGTWTLAPNPGDLWTPGYWAFERAAYFWHIGYWGPRVGFYGGINYGHGYSGSGYEGGRWDHGAFRYNSAISNVQARAMEHAYSAPPATYRSANRTSFNGGRSGTAVQPSASERQFQTAEHGGPRSEQLDHENAARGMPTQRATGPHGMPQVAATPKPSAFSAPDVEHVRTAPARGAGRPADGHGEAAPAHRPQAEPQRTEPQRTEPQRAAPQRAEPKGPAGHADEPQQEGRPRKER